MALGVPVGTAAFTRAHANARMQEERRLLDLLPRLPDLQTAWLLLRMCAVPRANHLLRTLPPPEAEEYARLHDQAVWACFLTLLGEEPGSEADSDTRRLAASLPGRLGGLGLTNALRTSPAAYWAGWADALAMLSAPLS